MKSLSVTIPMKATEQYFPVILVIMLYKMVLTFQKKDRNNFKSNATWLSSSLRSFCSVPFLGGREGEVVFVRSYVCFFCLSFYVYAVSLV